MKYSVILFLTVLMIALTESKSVSIEIETKEAELKAEYCQFPKYSPFRRECALFKCSKDGKRVIVTPCPWSKCSNKLSYNEETYSKPYPECCAPLDC